ncbi:helix-turn-helix transcriptional regulator [Aeromonas dhakensis]|uniref:helix-turn-helix transcriptional regulator n=1 Tax=Aeromonas dhakensis TaxID=196024 RepID=UPI0009E4AB1B
MFISTSQVSTRLGVSRSTVERLRRNPEACFPKPINIGPNSVRYNLTEIEQWLESRRKEGEQL